MNDAMRGIPLLSGPPPPVTNTSHRAEISCRKCNKEFNVLFSRSRRCNHCGYSYCSSCSDYQALMPRGGTGSGYEVMPVCAFCIENLTITAGGKGHLRSLPLARLKKYMQVYNIRLSDNVLEKDDVVDALIAVRMPNGCLPQANEEFYRKYSVPNRQGSKPRGLFTRASGYNPRTVPNAQPPEQEASTSRAQAFPRPDLEPDHPHDTPPPPPPRPPAQQPRSPPPRPPPPRPPPPSRPQAQYASPRGPPPRSSQAFPHAPRPQQAPSRSMPPRSAEPYPRPTSAHPSPNLGVPSSLPNSNLNVPPPRQRATSAASAATPPPPPAPVPALDALLQMPQDDIAKLSISTLKSILFQNHVNARLVLEKAELVSNVRRLLDNERQEREREAALRELEEQEILARQRAMMEEHRAREEKEKEDRERNANPAATDRAGADVSGSSKPLPPKAQAMAATLERNGLCVICQDEEANIAIVDCGHLALCRPCSELIMSSSRECPLCRTRIVTEARLLRIFKT